MSTNTRTPLSTYITATGTATPLASVALTLGDGIVVWAVNNGNLAPTVADNAAGGSNTYSATGTATYSASDDNMLSQFVCKSAKATETVTITATLATTQTNRGIGIVQYYGHDGAATPAGVISAAQTPGGATDAVTTGNITPTAQPGLFLGLTINSYANAQAAGTGFTDLGVFANWGAFLSQENRIEKKTFAATTATPMTWTDTAGTGRNQSAGIAIVDGSSAQTTGRDGILTSAVSAFNGIAAASISAINGLTK